MTIHNYVIVQQAREPTVFGPVALFFLIGIVALVVNFWTQILACLLLGAVISVAIYLHHARAARLERLRIEADLQNQQFLRGDPRGIYGDFHEGQK